ncbi:MAG: glycosyltransferase [Nitrospirae bacterium]|nr:glycosyltransferase [Nitrospirota bacterium]
MEGLSIIIPVFNKIETTRKCIGSIREQNRDAAYEIIIVDNGSTDETQQTFTAGAGPMPDLTYIRNTENLGVSKALNIGAEAAKYDVLCFMHNDVFISRENWTADIYGFISKTAGSGVVGLYGAKTIRKDATFRGKSIVHAKKNGPSITRSFEKVAVVDGLLLAMKKAVYHKCRGFCDGFSVHYYDKDISLRAYKNGFVNYVLNIPFEHICATTRSQIPDEDSIRDEAQKNFTAMWDLYLPVDVSTWRDRITYTVKRRKAH